MTDAITALEAQKKTIVDAIAAINGDAGRPLPFRAIPTNNSARLSALTKQLAVVNMKIKLAQKQGGAVPTLAG